MVWPCSLVLFFRTPPLAGTQPNFATFSKVGQIWKQTSKLWEFLFPKTRGPKTLFGGGFTTTAIFKRKYHFRNKMSYWQTKENNFMSNNFISCLHVHKNGELWSTKGWDYVGFFDPCTLREFRVFLIANTFKWRWVKSESTKLTTCWEVSQILKCTSKFGGDSHWNVEPNKTA